MVVVICMEIGGGLLFRFVGGGLLLVLGELFDDCWTIVCS